MSNCKKCGACCRYLSFGIPDLTPQDVLFYKTRGVFVWREEDDGVFIIVVPQKCQMLGKNLCKIHQNKPKPCRDASCPKSNKWFKEALRYYEGSP